MLIIFIFDHVLRKKKQRQTQTTMHSGHRIHWSDIKGSNGLDKGPRTMEVIHSYP